MARHHCQLLLVSVAALLFTFIQTGASIKCYVCTSAGNNTDCEDPINKTKNQPEQCDLESSVCLKRGLPRTASHEGIIQRSCADPEYCKEFGKSTSYCYTCNEDSCNSSSKFSSTIYIILIPIFFYSFYDNFIYKK